ncbi:hypothetical protein F0P96_11455 [Hymenobacter busanensis]|uniref:Uncharacterized protein n=1 Tax=Hymenobacter busanensis TaxID=2607656 RepID=A0A7L4ZVU8_9BACT|nr:hypothetical protein [Hymenobacter busanensis]KAA9332097.1 hypothetical protein F0P96_11455 [Hymenobacter busanensis]QHJ07564.1 hypothetical protein GUY19_09815 [Hymenobacter busanensis]
MSDAFLLDINLQQLPDDYLTGEWRVADRVLNQTDPSSHLAQATSLRLEPGALHVQTGASQEHGQWSVQRDALLSRPYLELQLPEEETRALITRLRRSADGLISQLSLYFLSGMEVQLTRP